MAAAPALARPTSPDSELSPSGGGGDAIVRSVTGGVVVVAVAAGVALRLYTRSSLWLDEALTVNIASLPLSELTAALRRDGAPPLYYVLLHGWMAIAGGSDIAVRSLSAVFGVATLPLLHRAGRRLGGAVVGVAALVLIATSPFALRYATEARMYTLVALLVTVGWLVLRSALERPTPFRLAGTGALGGALLLTHYWSFYLVGVTVVALSVRLLRRPEQRRTTLLTLGAVVIGSVLLFAPWVPSFLYQRAHTGTPWGTAPGPVEVAFTTLVDLGGGPYPEGQALAGLLAALCLLALAGKAIDAHRIELDIRTRPGARVEAVVGATTLLIAVAVGTLTASAFASRYTSVAFPLVILVAAYGLRAFGDKRVVVGILIVASLLGVAGGVRNIFYARTQAPEVAAAMAANGARAGDIVVYCPDQLGPDVSRVLPRGFRQMTFPDLSGPKIVDWVDYGARMHAADPAVFAAEVLRQSAGRNIFYVWMPGYRTLDKQCERVNDVLGNARPGNRQLLEPDKTVFQREVLWLHPARPASS